MKYSELFENRTSETSHITKYRRLYHLTDNYGLGMSVETDTLKSLRQDYISTTYRRETSAILGRAHYHYKLILDAKKLARDFGLFDYDHQVTEIGTSGERTVVSADEAEIGVDTRMITNLSEYLVGVVIMSKPYTERQVLFLADINTSERGFNNPTTIHAITALNKLTVPMYWQDGEVFIPLMDKDKQYLRDIETFMHEVGLDKKRNSRHLDLLDKLLDKYDIKDDGIVRASSLDREVTFRRRLVPKIMAELNGYFGNRWSKDIDPSYLRNMMMRFLKAMRYGSNAIAEIMGTADEQDFFNPIVPAVAWTGVLRNLVSGDIAGAIDDIKDQGEETKSRVAHFKEYDFIHYGTGMSGDHE